MDEGFWDEIERSRKLSGAERMRLGLKMFDHGRNYIGERIRDTFPEASETEVAEIRRFVMKRCRDWGIA
jgi:hypothetical protein